MRAVRACTALVIGPGVRVGCSQFSIVSHTLPTITSSEVAVVCLFALACPRGHTPATALRARLSGGPRPGAGHRGGAEVLAGLRLQNQPSLLICKQSVVNLS